MKCIRRKEQKQAIGNKRKIQGKREQSRGFYFTFQRKFLKTES